LVQRGRSSSAVVPHKRERSILRDPSEVSNPASTGPVRQKGQCEVGLQRPERTGRNEGDQRAADGEKRRAGDLIRRVSADKANGAEQNAMIRSNIDTMIPETDVRGATS
jgi:hypothetical protein